MSLKYTNEAINSLSNLLQVNVQILQGNQVRYVSKKTTSAYEILNIPETTILHYVTIKNPFGLEIIDTRYQEQFMVITLPELTYLVLGPFFLKRPNLAEIRKRLRIANISLLDSNRLLACYEKAEVLTLRLCQGLFITLEELLQGENKSVVSPEKILSQQGHQRRRQLVNEHYQGTIAEDRMDYRVRSPIALENKLLFYIEQGRWDRAKKTLEEINSLDSAVLATDAIQSKRCSLVAGCTLYTRGIIKGGIDYTTAFSLSDALIRTINKLATLEELAAFEYEMVEIFCDIVKEKKETSYPTAVIKAIEYINSKLVAKITLEEIAQHVFLHPNYLSKLFKEETGTSMREYIQKMRIEESKLLLLGTNEKISAISNYYQFCNEAYYIKVFKKFEKITPNQFRVKYLK